MYWVLAAIAFAIATGIAADARGRSGGGWALAGLLFGPLALVAVLVAGKPQPVDPQTGRTVATRACVACFSQIDERATICPHCRTPQPEAPKRDEVLSASNAQDRRFIAYAVVVIGVVLALLGAVMLLDQSGQVGRGSTSVASTAAASLPEHVYHGTSGWAHFVVLPEGSRARADVEALGRRYCAAATRCTVIFWTDARKAATFLPMTDEQVQAIYAQYTVNRSTGLDRLTCHPFGDRGERCN